MFDQRSIRRRPLERFVTRHGARIVGILSGLDRMLFRGTLRSISYVDGLDKFLSSQHVLYKDFSAYVPRLSERLKTHAIAVAAEAGRPYEYIASAPVRKEDVARAIAERDGVTEGVVCVLACVEPCRSFTIRRDRDAKRLRLVSGDRKCRHLYVYDVDRDFGRMHIRLQTWLPLTIQVCVNGRAWLARQLARAGVAVTQVDNGFTAIADGPRAQTVADDLIDWPWEQWLRRLGHRVNPWVDPKAGLFYDDYWTVRQREFATDVMFRDAASLQAVYPRLLRHGIEMFHSEDVWRFLGHRPSAGLTREVQSDLQRRPEGVRIKHGVHENSITMYDKAGRLLRIETTINNPDRFKVRRENATHPLTWLPLRKGIADMRRRAAIGRAANAPYLDALSVVGESTPSHHLLDPVSQRVVRDGRPSRALRPISPHEAPLLRTILRGEFLIHGFTNRDVRTLWDPDAGTDPVRRRQASARVTRHLRLLRAHGLIKNVPRTHAYRVTDKGEAVMSTAITFRDSDIALVAAGLLVMKTTFQTFVVQRACRRRFGGVGLP